MALSANTYLTTKNVLGESVIDGVVTTSTTIYHHALVVRRSTGRFAPAGNNGTTTRFVGLAQLGQKNPPTATDGIAGDGTKRVNCIGDVDVLIACVTAVTVGHVGTAAYAVDDASVTNATTLGPQVGIFTEFVQANLVWVRLRGSALSAASA